MEITQEHKTAIKEAIQSKLQYLNKLTGSEETQNTIQFFEKFISMLDDTDKELHVIPKNVKSYIQQGTKPERKKSEHREIMNPATGHQIKVVNKASDLWL